ncbi:MAG: hypothetical protein OQK82_09000 [Candidatus Pacearchaeota archaeon]|nr:hypothetical protein [Candidatus Pacearchaeota archaeon]
MRSRLFYFFIVGIFMIIFIVGIVFGILKITGESITGVLKEEENPKELFDISISVDDSIILDIDDLVLRVNFESYGTVTSPVNLTFIILDEIGESVYIEEDYIIIETEKIFVKKFENLDFEYGRYKILLKTLYGDNIEDEFWTDFEIRKNISKSFFQLFDINFNLENTVISGTEELVARTELYSFGSEPTPVNLKYAFFDETGKELYSKEDYIIVETEKVISEKFGDLGFSNGKYSLVLTTLYNVNIKDEFVRKFEIREKNYYLFGFWLSIFFNLLLGFFIFRLMKEKYNPRDKYKRKKRKS